MTEVKKDLGFYINEAAKLGTTCAAGADSLMDLAEMLYEGTASGHFGSEEAACEAGKRMYHAYADAINERAKHSLQIVAVDVNNKDALKSSYSRLNRFARLAGSAYPTDTYEMINRANELLRAKALAGDSKGKNQNRAVGKGTYTKLANVAAMLLADKVAPTSGNWNHITDDAIKAVLFPVKKEEAPSADGIIKDAYNMLAAASKLDFTPSEKHLLEACAMALAAKVEELKTAPIVAAPIAKAA